MVKTVGEAACGTNTEVILGTVVIHRRPWFLRVSGLDAHQMTNGYPSIHAYAVNAVTLPTHPPTDADLFHQADLAYCDRLIQGLILDDSSPTVACLWSLWCSFPPVRRISYTNAVKQIAEYRVMLGLICQAQYP